MPVRAKLLAAGGATCAYQISAKAFAVPECSVIGNWRVTHCGDSSGLSRREGIFLGSSVRTEL